MARINIEDDLFKRGEWFRLVVATGSPDTALGALVRVWMVAQRFWFPNMKLIPAEIWERENLSQAVVDCGLAEVREGGIYVRGSEEQFAWLFSASEKGRKGGQASAKKLKKKKKSAPQVTTGAPQVNHSQAAVDLSAASYSSSYSNKNIIHVDPDGPTRVSLAHLEEVYQEYPRREGKSEGLKKARSVIKTPEDLAALRRAVHSYKRHLSTRGTDPQYVKLFSTFMNSWRDWLDPDAGSVDALGGKPKRERIVL